MFEYEFMRRAFIIGGLLALILPCIGIVVLLKRISMVGDTLSHSSLAGVTIGLCFGIDPLFGAIMACIFAGLSIEFVRNKLKSYQEVSTVIILAAAIGLAGIFAGLIGNSNSINSYLFGSIITISDSEFILAIASALIILVIYRILYNRLYLSVFDEKAAPILGINTKIINFIFTILTAITISISAKLVGSLVVSSLLIIPVISAMQTAKTYFGTLILAILYTVSFMMIGLALSYFYDLKPGSIIVLLSVVWLIITILFKKK